MGDAVVSGSESGLGAGVLRVPAPPDRSPLGGEVAVQVDASPVLSDSERGTVRVELMDEPDDRATRRPEACEPAGDGDPGALVPVDAADDEDAVRGLGVADDGRADRPPLGRAAEDALPLGRSRRRPRRGPKRRARTRRASTATSQLYAIRRHPGPYQRSGPAGRDSSYPRRGGSYPRARGCAPRSRRPWGDRARRHGGLGAPECVGDDHHARDDRASSNDDGRGRPACAAAGVAARWTSRALGLSVDYPSTWLLRTDLRDFPGFCFELSSKREAVEIRVAESFGGRRDTRAGTQSLRKHNRRLSVGILFGAEVSPRTRAEAERVVTDLRLERSGRCLPAAATRIRWRRSRSLGLPYAGRLVGRRPAPRRGTALLHVGSRPEAHVEPAVASLGQRSESSGRRSGS